MLVKIYAMIWVLGLLMVGAFYFTGNLGPVMKVVFGFLTFGAVFLGMMNILPDTVAHRPAKH
jgi:hypothetical protein